MRRKPEPVARIEAPEERPEHKQLAMDFIQAGFEPPDLAAGVGIIDARTRCMWTADGYRLTLRMSEPWTTFPKRGVRMARSREPDPNYLRWKALQGAPKEDKLDLLKRAAERGHPRSQYILGLHYIQKETEAGAEEGMIWLQTACYGGYEDACEVVNEIKARLPSALFDKIADAAKRRSARKSLRIPPYKGYS